MDIKRFLSEEGLIRYTRALDLIFPSKEEAEQHAKDIAALQENKVSKEEGKSLIPDEDLEQISQNKDDIASLQEEKADKTEVVDLSGELQDISDTLQTTNDTLQDTNDELDSVSDRVTALEEKLASSICVSEQAPSNPVKNTVWFDLKTRLVKVWNGSAWISFGAVYQ